MAELVNRVRFTAMVEEALNLGNLETVQAAIETKQKAAREICRGNLPESSQSELKDLDALFREQLDVVADLMDAASKSGEETIDPFVLWQNCARFYTQNDGTVMCECGGNEVLVGGDFAEHLKLPFTAEAPEWCNAQFEAMMTGCMYWVGKPYVTEVLNRIDFTGMVEHALRSDNLVDVCKQIAAKHSAVVKKRNGLRCRLSLQQLDNLQKLFEEQLDTLSDLMQAHDADVGRNAFDNDLDITNCHMEGSLCGAKWHYEQRFYLEEDGTATFECGDISNIDISKIVFADFLGGSELTCVLDTLPSIKLPPPPEQCVSTMHCLEVESLNNTKKGCESIAKKPVRKEVYSSFVKAFCELATKSVTEKGAGLAKTSLFMDPSVANKFWPHE